MQSVTASLLTHMRQTHDPQLPLELENPQVASAQHAAQCLITGGVGFLIRKELSIKLLQQTFLLQVIEQVTRLCVVRPALKVVELRHTHTHQFSKRWHPAGFDVSLQSMQPPVGEAVDAAIDFT